MILPADIGGVKISGAQRVVLADIVNRLVLEAKYSVPDAIKKAIEAFQVMFFCDGDRWKAHKKIRLQDHGTVLHSKFYNYDLKASEHMGRKRADKTVSNKLLQGESVESVIE